MLPLKSYGFRIDLMGKKAFNDAIMTFKVNLVDHLIEIGLRETRDCSVFPLIMDMLGRDDMSLTWEGLAPNDDIVMTIFYHGLKVSDHAFEQSYTDHQSSASHRLVFSFERTETL